jgi:hypothetical protein
MKATWFATSVEETEEFFQNQEGLELISVEKPNNIVKNWSPFNYTDGGRFHPNTRQSELIHRLNTIFGPEAWQIPFIQVVFKKVSSD